jgi:formylmethanofuran dehydrogenase subunit C
MSLELTLHTAPRVPLEADVLTPGRLRGLSATEAAKLVVVYGNQAAELGEFFRISGAANGEIHLTGDLSHVKQIGAGMAEGRIVVHGPVGMHVGSGMTGGEIIVEGDTGDWVGPEMSGGRIVVQGNAGHLVGSSSRGSAAGLQGGEILVFGNAGNEVGGGMRRGLIVIGGSTGDFTGVNMLAGTVIVFGQLGARTGAGMKRGSIVSMHPADMLPTFSYACTYRPVFLRVYLSYLRGLGFPVTQAQMNSAYQRWCGDSVELNRGEILCLDSGSTAAGS